MRRLLRNTGYALLAIVTGCTNDPAEVRDLTKRMPNIEHGKNITAFFSQSANRKAYLTAPTMARILEGDTTYSEFPDGVHVEFFDELGQLSSTVNARYSRYFENLNKVFLKDSVVVYNIKGDTLYAKTLWWDQNRELLYTEDSVHVITSFQNTPGTGLVAKSDFSSYTIYNIVGPVVLPPEGQSMGPGGSSGPPPQRAADDMGNPINPAAAPMSIPGQDSPATRARPVMPIKAQ